MADILLIGAGFLSGTLFGALGVGIFASGKIEELSRELAKKE